MKLKIVRVEGKHADHLTTTTARLGIPATNEYWTEKD